MCSSSNRSARSTLLAASCGLPLVELASLSLSPLSSPDKRYGGQAASLKDRTLGVVHLSSTASHLLELSHMGMGFPGGSDGKETACNAGDLGSIPGLGRSPGGEHGNPIQNSCLENPHGQRSLAGYSPWGCNESDTEAQHSHVGIAGCRGSWEM